MKTLTEFDEQVRCEGSPGAKKPTVQQTVESFSQEVRDAVALIASEMRQAESFLSFRGYLYPSISLKGDLRFFATAEGVKSGAFGESALAAAKKLPDPKTEIELLEARLAKLKSAQPSAIPRAIEAVKQLEAQTDSLMEGLK
jgi:hypothetical protein